MSVELSRRMAPMNPSAIREIFKFAGLPGMISFAGGNPSERTFPAAELAEVSARLFADKPSEVLQYGITEGYMPLRELTKARMREKFGVGSDDDDVLMVTGGQQGLDMALKCLTNEGDAVIVENPSFIGALNAIRGYDLRLIGVPMDRDGMDMDALEQALRENEKVRLIYTIPDFQNPMGVTMTLERRKRLCALAERYDVTVIEDNPYFEMRCYGDYVPCVKSFDETGRVIFCGSYSKTVAPGLRVGFIILPKRFTQKFTVAKQVMDVHSANFPQMLVYEYVRNYDFEAHVEDCRRIYRVQRDLMVGGLEKNLAGLDAQGVRFTKPMGGFFIWVDLPKEKSGYDLFEALVKKNLATVPGSTFDPAARRDTPGIRLNYSMPTPEQIETGTKIFGETVREFIR